MVLAVKLSPYGFARFREVDLVVVKIKICFFNVDRLGAELSMEKLLQRTKIT